ncbi:MAG: hypothetical protein JWN46_763, partial [Acidimicrobiales bacterium]|nr:hypothetical protein [Acidimicrobiales bacterium]
GAPSSGPAVAPLRPWAEGSPAPPGMRPLAAGEVVDAGAWSVAISADGALAHAVHRPSGWQIADADHPLGQLGYQTFDEASYASFYAGLTPVAADEWWARLDNTKPGIDAAGAVAAWWAPELVQAWHGPTADGSGHQLVAHVRFPTPAVQRFGAAPSWCMRLRWFDGSEPLSVEVSWFDKPACRLPEAAWCSFVPHVAEPTRWTLDKLGQLISPLDVVRHGGRSLHGVGHGMAYAGPDGALRIGTLDAPLVAPGRPNLLDADPPLPDLAGGFHVLLHDNLWGTNFPMWSEGDAHFRFTVGVDHLAAAT